MLDLESWSILECKDQQGQIVVPVFYEVDPSQVRKLEEGFGAAFAKHESDPKVGNEEVKGWKSALTRATTLSGHHSTNYQDDDKLNYRGDDQNLVYMDLSYSKELIRDPDFSDAKKLNWLNLEGCSSLLEVDPSISALESILYLNLKGCSNLRKFPNISGNMKELRSLSLDWSAIAEVPSSVNDLPVLKYLSLTNCRELRSLPSSIHMESLHELDLSGCSKLAEFPEISEVMVRLTKLCLDDTAIEKLPSSIINFTSLRKLSVRGCRSLVCLPEEICNLEYLKDLDLTGCSNMEKLPENFANVKSLREPITLAGSGIKQLPIWILGMETVSFKGCKEISAPFSSWPTWNPQIHSGSNLFVLDLRPRLFKGNV